MQRAPTSRCIERCLENLRGHVSPILSSIIMRVLVISAEKGISRDSPSRDSPSRDSPSRDSSSRESQFSVPKTILEVIQDRHRMSFCLSSPPPPCFFDRTLQSSHAPSCFSLMLLLRTSTDQPPQGLNVKLRARSSCVHAHTPAPESIQNYSSTLACLLPSGPADPSCAPTRSRDTPIDSALICSALTAVESYAFELEAVQNRHRACFLLPPSPAGLALCPHVVT